MKKYLALLVAVLLLSGTAALAEETAGDALYAGFVVHSSIFVAATC